MDDTGPRRDDAADIAAADIAAADHVAAVMDRVETRPEGKAPRRRRRRDANQPPALRPPIGIVAASIFGMVAAVFYTIANIALRYCVGVDPFLVSAVKAAPTVLLIGPFLGWMLLRGETIAISSRMVPRFIAAALLGQFVGNVGFQLALGVIGLAASVPITLGVLIIGGAVLGRVMLHEPVRPRTVLAIFALIAAVIVLSLPDATEPPSQSTTELPIWVGALCAAASGAAYAVFGVVMRQALTGGLSVPATMFISGVVGTIALWSATLVRIGIGPLEMITSEQWGVMLAAGAFNFTAFVALSVALKSLPVVAVNLINASQVAMAAAAGVMLFAEPVTTPLIIGILLTFVGLVILANRRRT
jgi:drug/metabolite transporter (DMT)-like permease